MPGHHGSPLFRDQSYPGEACMPIRPHGLSAVPTGDGSQGEVSDLTAKATLRIDSKQGGRQTAWWTPRTKTRSLSARRVPS
jgi:hypothetical protein